MDRKKAVKLIILSICFILVVLIIIGYTLADTTFELKLTPLPTENSNREAVNLDWSTYTEENVIFKGYQSTNGGAENSWKSISLMDYSVVKDVRVLQVYPDVSQGQGQLNTWMNTNGYGKGIIKVSEVSMTNFNTNPSAYLYKDSKGSWNHDIIFFGTWDRNSCFDLSSSSYNVVDQFIGEGYGCIFGHDTIYNNSYFSTDSRETSSGSRKKGQVNFDKLADKYFDALSFGSTQGNQLYYGGNQVQIVKKWIIYNISMANRRDRYKIRYTNYSYMGANNKSRI